MQLAVQKKVIWCCFFAVSILSALYTTRFFSVAFPIVNLAITVDRDQAITQATELAQRFRWGPESPFTALSFETDNNTKTFIELEGGGQDAFIELLTEHWYEPYLWHVRLFKEFEINETHVYITPDGKPYGFKEIIPDDQEMPSFKKRDALALAQENLTTLWNVDLEHYAHIQSSKHVQENGRVDRTFVFERTDRLLKEGRYRVQVAITGNKITQVEHYIKVPESFILTYAEMRSHNNAIASAGAMVAYLLYLLIGCIVGLFILVRLDWVIWKHAIAWGMFVALLEFLSTCNSLPLLWMYYKTETAMSGFLLQLLSQEIYNVMTQCIIMIIVFATAEGLTRKAFGGQIQLWKSWSTNTANSYTMLARTVGSYLTISIDLAFLVTFYIIATRYFNWWCPIGHLADPDILASYFPWLSSIAISLRASFLEECKYRAIPIAGAALIGRRFGKERWWMIAAFILQAIVFGAAHASYPTQPAYARLVELLFPSLVYGWIYIRFGLLTSVTIHFGYDVLLFALPIFFTHSWFNQITVILVALTPLWIILYRKIQSGTWISLSKESFNSAWQPNNNKIERETVKTIIVPPLTTQKKCIFIALAMVGAVACGIFTRFSSDAPPLRVSSDTVITAAQESLKAHAPDLFASHLPYTQLKKSFKENEREELQHSYIWQTYGKDAYHSLLGSYLQPARLLVRFLRFDGSLIERAQEYAVTVGATQCNNDSYGALEWQHRIPEKIAGAQLTRKEALALALQALQENGYDSDTLVEIKAKPHQLPERTDWNFTFGYNPTNTDQFSANERRIKVSLSGDQIVCIQKKIHVPELYKRHTLKVKTVAQALQLLCLLMVRMLFIVSMLCALIAWAKRRISTRLLLASLSIFGTLFVLMLANNFPHLTAQFNTQASFINQLFMTYGLGTIGYAIRAAILAFALAMVLTYRPQYVCQSYSDTILQGIASGCIIQGAWCAINWFKPSLEPLWGLYKGPATIVPSITFMLYYITEFFNYFIALSLVAIAINYLMQWNKKYMHLIPLVAVMVCLTITGIESIESIYFWAISSLLLTLVVISVWYFIVRHAYASIGFAVATTLILAIVQQIWFNLLADIVIIGLATIAAIITIAIACYKVSQKIAR